MFRSKGVISRLRSVETFGKYWGGNCARRHITSVENRIWKGSVVPYWTKLFHPSLSTDRLSLTG